MAIITKSEITITKGFDTWQEMVYSIEDKLTAMGISYAVIYPNIPTY